MLGNYDRESVLLSAYVALLLYRPSALFRARRLGYMPPPLWQALLHLTGEMSILAEGWGLREQEAVAVLGQG